MEVFKKGLKSFIYHIVGATFTIALQFFAARLLGSEEYGKANYLAGFASSLSIIFSFGISFYFPKIFQEAVDHKRIFSGIFYSSGITYVIFFLGLILFYKTSVVNNSDYLILFFLAWSLILISYLKSFLIGIHSADKASKSGNFYLKLFSLLLFPITVFLLGRNYLALIFSMLISQFLVLIPFIKKNLILTKPNFSFIKYASVFYLIQLFYSFFGEFAKVLQGDFLGVKSVALLSISLVIGALVTIFGENFANVGLPIFAKAFKEKNTTLLKDKFQEISRINAFFILPIFFLLMFNSQEILGLFGQEFVAGSSILLLILSGSFVNSFTGPNGSVLLMSGKERLELLNGIIKFLIAVTISFIFGKRFIWGIALGLTLAEILVNLLKGFEVYYFYKILPLKKRESLYFMLIGLIDFTLFGLVKVFNFLPLYTLFFGLLLVLFTWFLIFLFSPVKSDREIIYSVMNYIRKIKYFPHSNQS